MRLLRYMIDFEIKYFHCNSEISGGGRAGVTRATAVNTKQMPAGSPPAGRTFYPNSHKIYTFYLHSHSVYLEYA